MISPSEYTLIEPSDCPKNQDHFNKSPSPCQAAAIPGLLGEFGLLANRVLAQSQPSVSKSSSPYPCGQLIHPLVTVNIMG